jgi:virginiamycin B lyase
MKWKLLPLLLLTASTAGMAQAPGTESNPPKPGVPAVQIPFASLKPVATFKVGETADWVLVTDDAVWFAASKPYSIQRIDPATNRVIAKVDLPAEACSGLAFGFGSIWIPLCEKHPSLVRVDVATNKVSATFPLGPVGPEGGIAASADSIWLVTGKEGTLSRIDPGTGKERQRVSIPPGSYNPIFADGLVWITGFESNTLTAVDAATGKVVASIPVGPKPRFLTAGGGSVWTLNQGDGTISRVDAIQKSLIATVSAGIPGLGGDICFGADSVWATVFDVPLSRIDITVNKVLRQWVGPGGDSMRAGFHSIWLTDYRKGLLWRFNIQDALAH